MVLTGASCKEKQPSADIITTKYVPKKPQAPIAMEAQVQKRSVDWLGDRYDVTVERTPADSLPMVKDENGQQYVDNRFSLSVTRRDGSVLLRKVFTKNAFRSYLDSLFIKDGILAGVRFDEADGNVLEFSVVVALPDAIDDVFVPLDLDIDRNGNVSIARNDDMDMLGYEEDSVDDDDDD